MAWTSNIEQWIWFLGILKVSFLQDNYYSFVSNTIWCKISEIINYKLTLGDFIQTFIHISKYM